MVNSKFPLPFLNKERYRILWCLSRSFAYDCLQSRSQEWNTIEQF